MGHSFTMIPLKHSPLGYRCGGLTAHVPGGLLSFPAKISWCVVTHENSPGDAEYSVRVARCARP